MIGVFSYLIFLSTITLILAIAVLGLNLQWGNTGLFNGGVVAFFGIGAYATVLLGAPPQADQIAGFGLAYPIAVMGGILAAGLLAWVVGLATLKLRHDYLAIATFGVAVCFENLVRNAEILTGGAKGLRGFERPLEALINDNFLYGLFFLIFVSSLCLLVYLFLETLIKSPFGRLLRAIREDEIAAQSLGKSPSSVRLTAFVIGGMIMGLSGAIYATFYAFVSPQDVLPIFTFQIWAMLIVGGAGNNRGAILGAFVIWGAWTASGWALAKFAPVELQIYTGSTQYILIGLTIVVMLLIRPNGILPEKLSVSHTDKNAGKQPEPEIIPISINQGGN